MKPPHSPNSLLPSRRFTSIVVFIFFVLILYLTLTPSPTPEAPHIRPPQETPVGLTHEQDKELPSGKPKPGETVPDFIPTHEWQEILPGQAIPAGLQIKMALGGKNYAKLPDEGDGEKHELIAHPGRPALTEEAKEQEREGEQGPEKDETMKVEVGHTDSLSQEFSQLHDLNKELAEDELNAGDVAQDRKHIVEHLRSLRDLVGNINVGKELATHKHDLRRLFRMVLAGGTQVRKHAAQVVQTAFENTFEATNNAIKNLGMRHLHQLQDATKDNPAAITALSATIVGNCRGIGEFWNHPWPDLDPKNEPVGHSKKTTPTQAKMARMIGDILFNLVSMVNSMHKDRRNAATSEDDLTWTLDLTGKHADSQIDYICTTQQNAFVTALTSHRDDEGKVPYFHVPARHITAINNLNALVSDAEHACWTITCGNSEAYAGAIAVKACDAQPSSNTPREKCKLTGEVREFLEDLDNKVTFDEDLAGRERENWKKPFERALEEAGSSH